MMFVLEQIIVKQDMSDSKIALTMLWLVMLANARGFIRFNLGMLMNEKNTERFIERTPVHEVAHLVVYEVYGRGGHGYEWRKVMDLLGATDIQRCHSYEMSSVGEENLIRYVCGCSVQHLVSKRKHNNILRGVTYFCKRCRKPLVRE